MTRRAPLRIGPTTYDDHSPFFLIAGPCVIESLDHARGVAERLRELTSSRGIPFVFKASYDKANRTSLASYRGPGPEEGLRVLETVRRELDVAVLSDIHDASQAPAAGDVLDMIQIPAFLCRQTDLLVAAARTGRPVNAKKGQFLAPWDMKPVVEKLRQSGAAAVSVTERGSSFGYNRLVVDFPSLAILAETGAHVVFDATHSVQQPGALGGASGGERRHVALLSRAAVAVGCDGLFLEVHPDPDRAPCDGPNMLPLEEVGELLDSLIRIREATEAPIR